MTASIGPATEPVAAAGVDDIPANGGLALTVAGRAVALFMVDGEPVAYEGLCRHKGGQLGDGFVRDAVVTCPAHWWRYDLRTGELQSDRSIRLRRYPTEVRDRVVFVTVPPAAAVDVTSSIRDRLLARARAERAGEEPA